MDIDCTRVIELMGTDEDPPAVSSVDFALPADLLRCVRWLGDRLVNESFMDPEDNRW